jgi:hypothetical protein
MSRRKNDSTPNPDAIQLAGCFHSSLFWLTVLTILLIASLLIWPSWGGTP